jgi:hypothetical protein
MKENLIIETQRIKELMGLKLISEIKFPGLDNIIKPLGLLTFKGLGAGEFEAAFPTVAKKTGEAIATFLKNTDDLTGPQVKVLLKLKNEALKNNIIQSISEDPITVKAVRTIMAGEERNNQGAIDLAKNALLEFLPIEELDNVIKKIKDKLNLEKIEISKKQIEKETRDFMERVATSEANYEVAMNLFNLISKHNGSKLEVLLRPIEFARIKAAKPALEKLSKIDFAYLNNAQKSEVTQALQYIKEINPKVITYIQKYFPKLSLTNKLLIAAIVVPTSAYSVFCNFFERSFVCKVFNKLRSNYDNAVEKEYENKTGGETKTGEKTTPIPPEPAGPCPAGKEAKMRGGEIICI